jgi:predicted RNA polymerase sigma factor
VELADEAIRLARMVRRMAPQDGEVAGLLALMLLTDARRAARITADGDLVPLPDQDRTLWDRAAIAEGAALVDEALATGKSGQYQIQAAIAALHDEAPTADATDWPRILALYDVLERLTGNPVVSLNRAVAVAMVHGPEAGLRLLDGIQARMAHGSRIDAVRAHLHEMAGDTEAAIACYGAAARQATNVPEQHYLTERAARLRHGASP